MASVKNPNSNKGNWLFALALTAPMALYYLFYAFYHGAHLLPTGFITYDNVSYIAYAKEYLDQEKFSLLYANPLNEAPGYSPIYFQTQTLFFALMLKLGFGPGWIIAVFNYLGTLASFRLAIALFDQLQGDANRRKLLITLFCWGGGLLWLAGAAAGKVQPQPGIDWLDQLFFLDPGWGWWGLNFGRGHFNSSEGYFHFLFLAAALLVLKQRWRGALAVSLVLSLSHPFTGIALLLVLTTFSMAERFVFANKNLPLFFVAGICGLLALHLGYYLFYLNSFPEHRSVSEQYSLNWRLRFFHMIPAYAIAGSFAIATAAIYRKTILKQVHNRLLIWWFLVVFALANHELLIKPMQPLHFDRGYIWSALFLLGLPALQALWQKEKWRWSIVALSFLLLLDNGLWLLNQVRTPAQKPSVSYLTAEHRSLLQEVKKLSSRHTLVLGGDALLPYLTTVYTPAHAWYSHPFTTPFAAQKQKAYEDFIASGKPDNAWKNRDLLWIVQKINPQEMLRVQLKPSAVLVLLETENYLLLRVVRP